MLRSIIKAALGTNIVVKQQIQFGLNRSLVIPSRSISSVPLLSGANVFQKNNQSIFGYSGMVTNLQNLSMQKRSLTKFSLRKGKRKAVKAVIKRFKRLDWGCWIRSHSGRNKKLFKKSPALRRRLKQHVLVNASQSSLLDKMVTKFWKKPKYYVNDLYEPYMKREEFWITRKRPAAF
ncbi:39S ribosomal protein L35, mitochondrial [Eupeodes corollae]|uniref:39S ribosomal protein L35, mitochondrial n=1 Tax=Eupeodes corollae TaxID=290404 RepID=UPI0024907048|nr:39S ribosomal protein L35, mitochondrial [Eupeodes corollae]